MPDSKPHSELDWTPAERVRQGIDSDSGEYGLQEDAHAALNGLLEQLEAVQEKLYRAEGVARRNALQRDELKEQLETYEKALRSIAGMGWNKRTVTMYDGEPYVIAREALNPASSPKEDA